jgi:hypothetical protein
MPSKKNSKKGDKDPKKNNTNNNNNNNDEPAKKKRKNEDGSGTDIMGDLADLASGVKDAAQDATGGGGSSYDFELLPCQKEQLEEWQNYEPVEDDDEECDPVKACWKNCQEMAKLRAKFCMEKRKELMEQLKEYQCTNTGCRRTMKKTTPCSKRRTVVKYLTSKQVKLKPKYVCKGGVCSKR